MLRTHLRKLSVTSLALGVGFASAGALAQSDGGSAASSPDALGGTTLFQTNGISSAAIFGSATDANAPSAPSATARRNADADALADLLRGDNSLSQALGRNVQDFAQHFAPQASDNGRRLGQTQLGGAMPTQTNADTQAAVGGTALAQTALTAPRAQSDSGTGTFGLQASDNGRHLGQTQRATSDDSGGQQLGQLRRSEASTIADQVASTKNALVAKTIDDSKGKHSDQLRKSENNAIADQAVTTTNALVTDTIDDSKGKQLGERRQSEEKTKNALVADTIDDSKGKHLGKQRQSEESTIADKVVKTKNALVADTIDDSHGKHLGKTKNALVADLIGASNVHSAASFPGTVPVSLGDGPSGALAAAPIPVPEPANWLLLALGLIVLAGRALMRRGTLLR